MKIEDLIELLKNRLNTFKISRDYARMSGDLERVNAADIEISGIEDTLYKLNLLVGASETAVAEDSSVKDVIVANSADVFNEYDITLYATDPLHESKVADILSAMGEMKSVADVDAYISMKYPTSPVTGQMVIGAATSYNVDARLMMAIMEQDSRFGTLGKAVATLNPGNVGNDDSGNIRTYDSWADGVNAVADWLNRHRGQTILTVKEPEDIPVEVVVPEITTTTPEIIVEPELPSPATSTPPITTTTAPIIPPTDDSSATSTMTTSTPAVSVPPIISVPTNASSTPPIIVAPPLGEPASSTPVEISVVSEAPVNIEVSSPSDVASSTASNVTEN